MSTARGGRLAEEERLSFRGEEASRREDRTPRDDLPSLVFGTCHLSFSIPILYSNTEGYPTCITEPGAGGVLAHCLHVIAHRTWAQCRDDDFLTACSCFVCAIAPWSTVSQCHSVMLVWEFILSCGTLPSLAFYAY